MTSSILRNARILSSESDNTIRQEQNVDVNIKIEKPVAKQDSPVQQSGGISYGHSTGLINSHPSGYIPPQNANFTQPQMGEFQYPSVLPTQIATREVDTNDLATASLDNDKQSEIDKLNDKNKFLELLLMIYRNNPLFINSYVIADNKLFMDMIKLLTKCDKVELILDENISCDCGCTGGDNLIYVSKILVTKDNKTEELKYAYNNIYSEFIKYNISTKIVSQ